MKANLFKGKSKRTQIFTLITVACIVIILVLNLLLSYFGQQKTVFFDMTPEGLYSLSDAMVDECDDMFENIRANGTGEKIKVIFCTDPDYLISSQKSRLIYFMALKLEKKYSDVFEVETVNVRMNPTAVAEYKTTSLSEITSNNIIVSYNGRYRVSSVDGYWATGNKNGSYYNGEYRIATLIRSVTSINQPKAYFVIDHNETYYDPDNAESDMSKSMAGFADLLKDRGLEIKTLKLSEVDRVPEDCALLIINNPRIDFSYDKDRLDEFSYVSDTEKIDRYLVMKQGAVMVAKDYRIKLPTFESFLHEWGFKFSDSVLVDKESSLADEANTATNLIAQYDTDTESYGYALYGEYADLSSSPLTVFSDSGSLECSFVDSLTSSEAGTGYASKQYAPYLTTSSTAQRYMRDEVTGEITSVLDGEVGKYDLAAVSVRSEIDAIANETTYSYLFCVNSASFLSNELLAEASYANYDILSAVVTNISRVDEYASMDLGALSANSASGGGKLIISTDMSAEDTTLYSNKYKDGDQSKGLIIIKENHGITTTAIVIYSSIIAMIPLALAITGIIVCAKRKYK